MRPRMPTMRKVGPCFGCGGNHWLQDCLDKPIISYKGERLPSIEHYCVGCSVDHLPKVCPHKPTHMLTRNPSANQGLNYLEVIPSPFVEEEEKDRASLRVVTRAQAQEDSKKEESKASEATPKKSLKRNTRRGRPKKAGNKSKSGSEPNTQGEDMEELTEKERSQGPTKQAKALTTLLLSHEGGSVLIDKKYEPLEATIQAYKSRLAAPN